MSARVQISYFAIIMKYLYILGYHTPYDPSRFSRSSYRKKNCLFATVRPFSFHTPRQVQKRRETFDYIHRNDPSLSKAEVALEVAKILRPFD